MATLKILHFSDAHIGAVNQGKHDAQTALPIRVLDFLKALDAIIDTAISEKVDLVLFSGDAYHHRNPSPTIQREWGRRIMRLSKAHIPTLLIVGNHDLSPSLNRAHALDSFYTLDVPNVHVVAKPEFLKPEDLYGLPLQVIALPYLTRSALMAQLGIGADETRLAYEQLGQRLRQIVQQWLDEMDENLPTIFSTHAMVQGAVYGGFESMVLGNEFTVEPSLVKNPRFDYVALGHIHKAQNLNEGAHPPVIYSGSIERVSFGEAKEVKMFVIAHIERGKTKIEWRNLETRPFIDRYVDIKSSTDVMEQIRTELSPRSMLRDAMVRLTIEYPRDWEALIDENALTEFTSEAFDFRVVRKPVMQTRLRLPENISIGSLTPMELLDMYWKSNTGYDSSEADNLNKLAQMIISEE